MRTFEDLVGDTERYTRGSEVWRPLRGLRKAVRRTGRVAKRGGKLAVRAHPVALTARAAGKGLATVTGPLRRRIFRAFFGKLITRRARLISWQRRRSMAPLQAERHEAQRWAAAYVRRKGVFGRLVSAALSGDVVGTYVGADPATSALITASIPVLIQLARRALKTAEGEGAPEDPRSNENDDTAVERG